MPTILTITDDDKLWRRIELTLRDVDATVARVREIDVPCPVYEKREKERQMLLQEAIFALFELIGNGGLMIVDAGEARFHPLGLWRNEWCEASNKDFLTVQLCDTKLLQERDIVVGYFLPTYDVCLRRDFDRSELQQMVKRALRRS